MADIFFAMTPPPLPADWLHTSLQNLARSGFTITENVSHASGPIRAVARRSRFEITKFGYSETFFVFREFNSLSPDAMRRFSAEAFRLAMQSKTIPLPCGLFESVWCYAVAIAPGIDAATADSVRLNAPPKHWAAAEIPVLRDTSAGRIYSFEKTPLWGAAYYAGFRSEIQRQLGHGSLS